MEIEAKACSSDAAPLKLQDSGVVVQGNRFEKSIFYEGCQSLEAREWVKLGNAILDLRPEAADKALDGPSGSVAESADGVALDLARDLVQHVDLSS